MVVSPPPLRISYINEVLLQFEKAFKKCNYEELACAMDILNDIQHQILSSEAYTESPLATKLQNNLIQERIYSALSMFKRKPIDAVFSYFDAHGSIKSLTLQEASCELTIEEVQKRIALEIGTEKSVAILTPGRQYDPLPAYERFCDRLDVMKMDYLHFVILPTYMSLDR
jgi:hypothetical protein